jgi:hypothetical protein
MYNKGVLNMKLVEIINQNAGDGFKLVAISFEVDGIEVEADFFIHPDGRIEGHKNAKYDLEKQIVNILKQQISKNTVESVVNMKQFSRTYRNWVISDAEHLNIREVESEGSTLEELLENARIYVETWHGGEGPDYSAGDLPTRDYRMLEEEFKSFLS